MSTAKVRAKGTQRGSWIPWLFVAFFALVVAVNGTMLWFALDSWTGMSANNPYDRGLTYNRNIAAAEAQVALGWRSRLEARILQGFSAEAQLILTDAQGAPIEGADVQAAFERPTNEGMDFKLPLTAQGGGVYRAVFDVPFTGQWQVHVTVRRGGDLFVHDERVMLR